MTPQFRNLCEIELHVGSFLEQREPFCIGLHHPVLDSVVHHLDEMPGTGRTDSGPAAILRRRQRLKQRRESLNGFNFATDHQAISTGEAPDPAACPDINKMDVMSR